MRSRLSRRGLVAGLLCLALAGASLAACGDTTESGSPTLTDAEPSDQGAGGGDGAAATTTTTTTADPALACIAQMPLRQRAAQTLAIAIDGGNLTAEAGRVADLQVGGVLLQRPVAAGLTEGITAVKGQSAIPPLVMVDEEGGESQALGPVVGDLPSEPAIVASGDPAAAEAQIAAHAQQVAALGVDVVLGPVVDVSMPGGGGPVSSRSFSDDPAQVTAYGAAYVAGWQAAGILPVLKHFPGHGAASGDSHDGPVSVPAIAALQGRDLVPFTELTAEPDVGVMVAHVVVPDLTGFTAASQSPEAIQGLLRDQMGFQGLVVTDSLSMGAIAFRTGPEVSFPAAIAAGADLGLFVTIADPAAAITAMEQAVMDGTVPEDRLNQAVARILQEKQLDPCTLGA